MQTTSAFSALVAPVPPETFFEEYWEQRALYLPGDAEAFPFSVGRDSFLDALSDCSRVRAVFQDPTGLHQEVEIPAAASRKLYAAGLSICASELERGIPDLGAMIQDLASEAVPPGRFGINGYLSPGGKGFGVHFDDHSVWILQVEGTKRWLYADAPVVDAPLANCVFPPRLPRVAYPWYTVPRPDRDAFNEVVLTPGDVLYLPAGTWHQTEAGDYSLSLTLGHHGQKVGTFVAEEVSTRAFRELGARRSLPGSSQTAPADAEHAFAEALDIFRVHLDQMTPADLVAAWERRASVSRPERPLHPTRAAKKAASMNALMAALNRSAR